MKPMSVTALREDLYNSIDKVAETGVPVEIERKGKKLKIILAADIDKFSKLKPHNTTIGDPDELVNIKAHEWQEEKHL